MDKSDTTQTDAHWPATVEHAAKGWPAHKPQIAHGLVKRFRDKLRAEVEIVETGDSFVCMIACLSSIRFLGSNNAVCLLAAGDQADIEDSIRRFWQSVSGPEQLVIVFALTSFVESMVDQ